jgi:ABC-type uncharacterized transport system substrate-binding protein
VAPRVSAGADRRDHSAARGARAAEGDAGDRLAHQRFARSECTECGRVPTGAERDGYVEGKNVAIEYRWAEGSYDRLPALASDLVGRKVDVIVTGGPALLAAKDATSTIPIVFFGGDPVRGGLVASLARPGGNLTGFSILVPELMPKRLELISELVPHATVIALLVNPTNPTADRIIRDVQEAARVKRVQLSILKAGTQSEIDTAFDDNERAILVQGDEGSAQVILLGHRGTPSVRCSDEVATSSPPAP